MIAAMILHSARFEELDVATLYAILKLRVDVFVVEQAAAYPELDGRDTEPATRHLWLAPDGEPHDPRAYLRILAEPDGGLRIGRVCTARSGRGAGLSGRLMAEVTRAASAYVLDAQSHLAGFYQRFGFVVEGREFIEDGIPHVPMRRAAPPPE
jgi:ElaA protein